MLPTNSIGPPAPRSTFSVVPPALFPNPAPTLSQTYQQTHQHQLAWLVGAGRRHASKGQDVFLRFIESSFCHCCGRVTCCHRGGGSQFQRSKVMLSSSRGSVESFAKHEASLAPATPRGRGCRGPLLVALARARGHRQAFLFLRPHLNTTSESL